MNQQLPPRPNLEQLKKQARALLNTHHAADAQALQQIQEFHPRLRRAPESRFTLTDAQLVIARQYGFATWSALRKHIASLPENPPRDAAIQAFLRAAQLGDQPRVTELLDNYPDILNEAGGPGTRTALHFATLSGHETLVRYLLDHGADPNIRCEGDNATPLHFAAEKERFGIIRLLVEHGADTIGKNDYHELEILGWSTCFGPGSKEVVDYLLAHGARHNIFSAVATGALDDIRRLAAQSPDNLERRMDRDNQRRFPLHLAVVKKQPQSLLTLLDLGANTESLDEATFTALDQAAMLGDTAMAQLLLDRGAKVRLPAAVALGRARDIEKLLRRDPDCLKPGKRWGNLIVRAAAQSTGAVVETLIRAGASVDVSDDPKTAIDSTGGYTPLHAAAFAGNLDAARVLLKHGANVRARDQKYQGPPAVWAHFAGYTAVRDLIHEGPIDIFQALEMDLSNRVAGILDREPDAVHRPFGEYLNHPTHAVLALEGVAREEWYTPLAFAVDIGLTEAARILLERGADATFRSPDGRTILERARDRQHKEVADLLEHHQRGA